jgi:hypothetical protein
MKLKGIAIDGVHGKMNVHPSDGKPFSFFPLLLFFHQIDVNQFFSGIHHTIL